MPKYLPENLEKTIPNLDAIVLDSAVRLAVEAKVSVADLIRLFQFRLELADRFAHTHPPEVTAIWLDPAWDHSPTEIRAAIESLDRLKQEYEKALQEPAA